MGVFAGSAGEAADGDVFFPGLGLCFFSIEFDCVTFFNGNCIFGTDAYTEAHAVTELLGYYFCFSVNDLNITFGAWSDAFSAASAFFFVDFYD
jgi:hypothetical protein